MPLAIQSTTRFPTTDEIKIAMETAGASIEGADYLVDRIKNIAANLRVINKSPELREKADRIITATENFAEYIKFKLTTNAQPWSGQPVESSDLKNMQQNIADAAAKELNGKIKDVKIDYAINTKGHFIRGYSANNTPLDADAVAQLDKIFNAWLAAKNYAIQEGYLYSADETAFRENNRMDADTVKELLATGGLKEFMANKGITNVEMQKCTYPSKAKEAHAKQKVQSAVKGAHTEEASPESSTKTSAHR